jgi:L-lactate utilization protein LutB
MGREALDECGSIVYFILRHSLKEKIMTPKQIYFENVSKTIIKNLKKRQMEGYYCSSSSEARQKVLSLIPDGSSVSWGGSETLKETGILGALKERDVKIIDRADAQSKEQRKELYANVVGCDFFLMSTNAITVDGELVNIDNTGNRVAFLCFGPEQVIVVAGMNKIVVDEEAGLKRVQNIASPPNTVRLNRKTPCAATGVCGNCLTPETICAQKVVTRFSPVPGRIKVILVGEELGF